MHRVAFLTCCCAFALAAADLPRYELPEPLLVIRLNDVERSVERYRITPYAAFMQTPTGKALGEQLDTGLSALGDGDPAPIRAILAGLRAAGWTFDFTDDEGLDPRMQLALDFADPAVFFDHLAARGVLVPVADQEVPTWHLFGDDELRWERRDGLAVLAGRDLDPPAVVVRAEPSVAVDPASDFEFLVDGSQFLVDGKRVPGLTGGGMLGVLFLGIAALENHRIEVATSLGGHGIQESIRIESAGAPAEALRRLAAATVSKSVFGELPATTIWALAWGNDAEATRAAFVGPPPDAEPLVETVDRQFQALGLPGHLDLLTAFDGTGLVYAEDLDGAYVVTIDQEIDQQVGTAIATAAGELLGPLVAGMPPPAFQALGFNAPPTLHAACRDGRLVVTLHPGGVDAVLQREGGFAALDGVQASLAALPDEGQILGLSDGARSWTATGGLIGRAVGAVAVPPLLANLGEDLGGVAHGGHLAVVIDPEDGVATIRSRGLVGPVSGYAGMLLPLVFWAGSDRPSPAPGAVAPPPGAPHPPPSAPAP